MWDGGIFTDLLLVEMLWHNEAFCYLCLWVVSVSFLVRKVFVTRIVGRVSIPSRSFIFRNANRECFLVYIIGILLAVVALNVCLP